MNKNLSSLLLVSVLAACSSTPGPEQSGAAVEERSARAPGTTAPATPAPPPPVTAKPVAPPAVSANPLKDPANILSKRSIFYDLDSDAIKDEYRPLLQAHARYLAANKGAKMLIQGNCDERGSREYNIALGQRRADGVKRMLILMGATEAQLESVSLGEEKPRCTADAADACLAQNRRSDVLYSGEY